MSQWSVEKVLLPTPTLQELAPCITAGLKANFKDVFVQIVECPDLRQKPYNLAAEGICGNARIADIGGPPNLAPIPKLDRKYSLLDMTRLMEMKEKGFVLGASAGPFHVLGVNSELAPNLSYDGKEVTNLSHCSRIDDRGECSCEKISSRDCGLMANLYGSDGSPGEVIKVVAKTRTGNSNFTQAIQDALKSEYGERPISMGGVFIIKNGQAKLHVMPDFSKTPLKSRDEVDGWLRYFDMSAPLVCLSVFHSHDPGLDLRMEHTHCFSEHGEGGHYHEDTTPDEVEYEAYFNIASILYRIDRPTASSP